MTVDTAAIYAKLADRQPVSEDEIVSLLKSVDYFTRATAYLGSCNAATLEGLPKSVSKAQRARFTDLCKTSARLIDGDVTAMRYPVDIEAAKSRCERALTPD